MWMCEARQTAAKDEPLRMPQPVEPNSRLYHEHLATANVDTNKYVIGCQDSDM